ncbi:hypothetical protein HZB94_03090 [Candidatus Falkowbacteria bacterium]|nr:hypothetical protein [Candidatus Falkowbacteria bacterium]
MKKVVMFVVFCFVAMATATAFAQDAPAPAPAATAPTLDAGTTVNVRRVGTLAPITVNVPPATVNVLPAEVTVMPPPDEEKSWCQRNPGWCAFTVTIVSAAVIGGGALALDGLGAFDREVSFK